MADTRNTAREYLRVSADPSGRLHSPAEQHDDNTRAVAERGWQLGEPYAERDAVSASRYGSKARAAFDALCRDLTAGAFGADVLILWESSRGSRRVGEWVSLIEACEAAAVLVHVTSHGRTYDPASARDRRSLLEDAVDSEYESAKISARTRRSKAARAAAGMPNGKVPYGYTRTYDPATRRLASQDPHPDEAPVVAELYARLRAGHSLKAISRDFAARGILTRGSKGHPPKPFSPAYLRDLALRPGYGGLRVHQPVTGRRDRTSIDGAVPAAWPGLVDAETWHAVHNLLTDPVRRTSRPGRGIHLLSLTARCGVCGGLLTVTYRGGGKRHDGGRRDYFCRDRSCIRIDADDLDAYAEAVMLGYLARPDIIEELRAGSDRAPELSAVRGDLEAVRGELATLRAETAAGRLSVLSLVAVEPGLSARAAALEKRERELSAPPALAGFIEPGQDAAARWDTAPMSARRQVARLLCSPGILGALLADRDPRPGRGQTPAAERVRWDRQ